MNEPLKIKTEVLDANSLNTYGDERRCHICKEIGHLKRNCPKNKFKSQNNDNRGLRNYNQSSNNSNKKSYNNCNRNNSNNNRSNYSNSNSSGQKVSHNSNNRQCESYKCL